MAESPTSGAGAVLRAFLLAGAGLGAILVALVPGGPVPQSWAMPDLLYCLVVAWVVRRPETAPFWLIFLLGLTADLMIGRPVGLGAILLVLAAEVFRSQRRTVLEGGAVAEWIAAGTVFALILGAQVLMLWITFANLPALGELLRYGIVTVAVYPIVVLVCHGLFRLRPHLPAARVVMPGGRS
ncbi:MAG: rod shape-determining protein MreD [Pseudomonadota bacterium]